MTLDDRLSEDEVHVAVTERRAEYIGVGSHVNFLLYGERVYRQDGRIFTKYEPRS